MADAKDMAARFSELFRDAIGGYEPLVDYMEELKKQGHELYASLDIYISCPDDTEEPDVPPVGAFMPLAAPVAKAESQSECTALVPREQKKLVLNKKDAALLKDMRIAWDD